MSRRIGRFASLVLLHIGFTAAVSAQAVPFEGGPLQIPYYGQGPSNYCWAASLQMVTEASCFDPHQEIYDIIGKVGVDEGGVTDWAFRMCDEIDAVVRQRCGVSADRQSWDYVNVGVCADYIRNQISVEGRPVAAFFGNLNHALVFVGYDGNDFIIHDPQGANLENTGYARRTWRELTATMARNDKVVTLAVPKALDRERPEVTVNIMNASFRFIQPPANGNQPHAYTWGYDHARRDGYSWRDVASAKAIDTFPSSVKELELQGSIDIVNSSQTQTRTVALWIDISAMSGTGHYSTHQSLTVGPNSTKQVKLDRIPVDAFRSSNSIDASRYVLTATIRSGDKTLDKAMIFFAIDSAENKTEAMSISVRLEGPSVVNQTASAAGDVVRTNDPDVATLHVVADSFPVQFTGRQFRAQVARRFSYSEDVTITGTFSADRKMIEELTVIYGFAHPSHGRETKWNFTARNIPFASERSKSLVYSLNYNDPAKRPQNFSVTTAEYLETKWETNDRDETLRHFYREDHFNASMAKVAITLYFYKSPTMFLMIPAGASTPARPAAPAQPRSGRR
jgi:hypothetical protein